MLSGLSYSVETLPVGNNDKYVDVILHLVLGTATRDLPMRINTRLSYNIYSLQNQKDAYFLTTVYQGTSETAQIPQAAIRNALADIVSIPGLTIDSRNNAGLTMAPTVDQNGHTTYAGSSLNAIQDMSFDRNNPDYNKYEGLVVGITL